MKTDRRTRRQDPARKFFSYVRYSTAIQINGDSERRQIALADEFARKNGIQFDDELKYRDRGVSGFKGQHRTKGALAAFLREVEKGNVPKGSVLVVENLDRLGREQITEALTEVIFKLINHDISIQTLVPMECYTRESINDNAIWGLIAHVQRANAESKRKSELITAAWSNLKKQARETGKIITPVNPSWLEIKGDKFIIKPGAKKAINQVYRLKLKGLGKTLIARKMNSTASWTPKEGGSWQHTYITRLIRYRAVIGEFQPMKGTHQSGRSNDGEPITGYYPRIVTDELFYAVQKRIKGNIGRTGENGKVANLFPHVVKCGYCGGSMLLIENGEGYQALTCDTGKRGVLDEKGNRKCDCHNINYKLVESTVLSNCMGLKPEQVLQNSDDQADEASMLHSKLGGIVGKIDSLVDKTERLIDSIEDEESKVIRDKLKKRIADNEQSIVTLKQESATIEDSIEQSVQSRRTFKRWKSDLSNLQDALGSVEARLTMRQHLRELISKVEIYSDGFAVDTGKRTTTKRRVRKRGQKGKVVRVREKDSGDEIEDYILSINANTKDTARFIDWVVARRKTKHGKFLRVHFKTGVTRDLVPTGSIASGRGLEEDGWGMIHPDLDQLYEQFKKRSS